MTPRELEEYRALRATIRERGTARVWIFVVGLGIWAGLVIGTAALAALPEATLLPLLTLGGVFEAVFALHTGVERVGRYLQVFYAAGEREWERTIMAYGRSYPGGADPLFSIFFILATFLNFVPVLLAEPVRLEVAVVGTVHLFFLGRVGLARRASGRQRALDLERFEQLRGRTLNG